MIYEYSGSESRPNLYQIENLIRKSSITNENTLVGSRYDEDFNNLIKIYFDGDLSSEDKTTLDTIVADAEGYTSPPQEPPKTRTTIMNDIFDSMSGQDQQDRILNAVDKYPSFIVALDSYGYPLARTRMQKALDNRDITSGDYDLFDKFIPNES